MISAVTRILLLLCQHTYRGFKVAGPSGTMGLSPTLSKVTLLIIFVNQLTLKCSGSVDALQRKEAEESACGKVHEPAFKIIEIYFQEK